MAVKIDMDMPKSCWDCPFLMESEKTFIYMGIRVGGKCKFLPIKDLEGEVVTHQTVVTKELIDAESRYKNCPLKECE